MDTFLQKALDAIPEWTYDLIARMLPGGIVVASLTSYYNFQTYGFAIGKEAGLPEVVVFLALAYAAGLAISTLAHMLYWFTWPFVYLFLTYFTDVIDDLTKSLRELKIEAKKLEWYCPLHASVVLDRAHDFIKTEHAQNGSVVTKLSAEVSLLYSLSIATGLYAALNRNQILVISAALLFAGYIRSIRLWHRHESILRAVMGAREK